MGRIKLYVCLLKSNLSKLSTFSVIKYVTHQQEGTELNGIARNTHTYTYTKRKIKSNKRILFYFCVVCVNVC